MDNKEEKCMVDSSRSNFEARQDDEINLYDYWKVLVKRKKILIGIFLIPLVIVTIVSLSLPRYYRGEGEISISALPAPNIPSVITAPNIVRLIGNIDDSQKVKIFTNNPGAIKSVTVSLPKKSTDKVNIIIDAKTADIIPQAFNDIYDYIGNLPGVKEEIARIQAETDLKLKKLKEEADFILKKRKEEIDLKLPNLINARKANLVFLNRINEEQKRQSPFYVTYSTNYNLSDIIMKDADLLSEITKLEQVKKDMIMKKELKIHEEIDFKIKKLIEARKANLIYLNRVNEEMTRQSQLYYINPVEYIKKDADLSLEIMNLQQERTDVAKIRKKSVIGVNPSDLIKKDSDLFLKIRNLQQVKTDMMKKKELNVNVNVGILGPPSITKQPSSSRIKQIIMITGLLSLFTGIFVVFFLEYIDRMKAREK